MTPEKKAAAPDSKPVKPIRLRPSSSDYVTAARTTADAMGLTGAAALKSSPDKRVLWLANLES